MARVTFDLLITGGTLVTGAGRRPGTVAVRDGTIAAVLEPGASADGTDVIDARGLHVLPGVIDTHVHTRHPGVPEREDFLSGTSAAAAGGITTIFEMPISKLAVNSGESLTRRAELLQSTAVIDYALYGGAGHENLAQIASQAHAGAIAFKTFLQPPPPTRLDEFFGLWCTDEAQLLDVMRAVAATGLRHCFHCEHTPTFQALERRLDAEGRRTGRAHAESRPPVVEDLSVATMLALAEDIGARVQVVHCSSPRSARLARDARARGVDATVETCPPYLFFSDEALDRLGPFAKCNPPLRSDADMRGLRQCVREGLVEVIGTDHSPFLAEDKARGAENIFLAPPGLAGLEVLVPLMLTAVHEGWLTLEDLARLLSENAARLFGLATEGAADARRRRRPHYRGYDGSLALRPPDGADEVARQHANLRRRGDAGTGGRDRRAGRARVPERRRGRQPRAWPLRAASEAGPGVTSDVRRSLLGVVTIGQTPRADLLAAFSHEAPGADVRVVGALDGLTFDEVAALAAPGEYPLLVRLADGTSAEIARDRLAPRVAACARDLATGARNSWSWRVPESFPPSPATRPCSCPAVSSPPWSLRWPRALESASSRPMPRRCRLRNASGGTTGSRPS